MKTLKLVKTGKLIQVENGLAHGMIERGEAVLVKVEDPHTTGFHRDPQAKEIAKAPHDKMMSKGRNKVTTK